MCCGRCRCPEVCNCNTSCCFGFRIPLDVGYVFCGIWFLFNGLAFPLISLVCWPKNYIFYASCSIFVVNSIFSCVSFANMVFKKQVLLSTVLYGVFATYVAGGLTIIISVNVDIDSNKQLLMDSFQRKFGVSVPSQTAFVLLQSIQIVFYAYLFVSYVYCGFVFQLYQIKHDKRYKTTRRV